MLVVIAMSQHALVIVISVAACHRAPTADRVPRTTGAITIDGEWDEQDWAKHALRAQLRGDDGELARPSSEVRFLYDGTDVLVALYAADENIESRDAFDLTIGELALHVDSRGRVTPAAPGVRAAVGYDEGTLDDPRDDDEEWVVELAIPASAAGLVPGAHPSVRVARCDVPKDRVRRCAAWTGTIALD